VSYLKGEVTDAKTGFKLSSDILLKNLKTNKLVRRITPAENQGSFLICLPSGENYGLSITRKGYLFASENISLINGFTRNRPREIAIRLNPVEAGASTTLKNIFFATDSWQLMDESAAQLDEMAMFMTLNPEVIMEVVGHTDRTGTEKYNLDLSQKRADAVARELLKRKIEPYRIKSKGVGFSIPVGDNNSEEGRSANRRTEFLVKSINKN
jgi:outer membrane protein OmpA-like peptidoglycan-associated protein